MSDSYTPETRQVRRPPVSNAPWLKKSMKSLAPKGPKPTDTLRSNSKPHKSPNRTKSLMEYSDEIQFSNSSLLARPKTKYEPKLRGKPIRVPFPTDIPSYSVFEIRRLIVFPKAGSYISKDFRWKIVFTDDVFEIRDDDHAVLFTTPKNSIELVEFSSTPVASKDQQNFLLSFSGDRAIKFSNEPIPISRLWVFVATYDLDSINLLKQKCLNMIETRECDYNDLKTKYLRSSNSISPVNFYGKTPKSYTSFAISPDQLRATRCRHPRAVQMDYKGMDGDPEPTPIEVFEDIEEAEEPKTAEVLYELISYEDQIVFQPSLHYKFDDGTKMAITNNDFKCLYNGNWINDTLVDFFIRYNLQCAMRDGTTKYIKFDVMSSFFYTKLSQPVADGDYFSNVKSWVKSNNNLFDNDYLIVPINEHLHWYFVVITNLPKLKRMHLKKQKEEKAEEHKSDSIKDETQVHVGDSSSVTSSETGNAVAASSQDDTSSTNVTNDEKQGINTVEKRKFARIFVLDSLKKAHPNITAPLKNFLVGYAKEKYGFDIKTSEIIKHTCSIPQQNNFYDCGLHVIYNLKKLFYSPREFKSKVLAEKKRKRSEVIEANKMFDEKEKKALRPESRTTLLELLKEQESAAGGDSNSVGKLTNKHAGVDLKTTTESIEEGDDDDIVFIDEKKNDDSTESSAPALKKESTKDVETSDVSRNVGTSSTKSAPKKLVEHLITLHVDHSKLSAKNKTSDSTPMESKSLDQIILETKIPKKKSEVHKAYSFNNPKRKSKPMEDISDEEFTKEKEPPKELPTDAPSPINFEDSQPEYSTSHPPFETLPSQPISEIPNSSEFSSLSSSRPSTVAGDEAEKLVNATKLVNEINKEVYSQSQSDTDEQVTDFKISSDEPSKINLLRSNDTINKKEIDSEPEITIGREVIKVDDDVRRGGNTKRHLRNIKPKSYEEHPYISEPIKGKPSRSSKKEEKIQKSKTHPNIPTGPKGSKKSQKPDRKRRGKSNGFESEDDDDEGYVPENYGMVHKRRHVFVSPVKMVEADDEVIEQIDSVDGGKDVVPVTNRKLKFKGRHSSESPAHLDDEVIEQIDSVDGGKDVVRVTNRKPKFKGRHLSESPAHLDDDAIEQIDSVDGGKDVVRVTNRKLKFKGRHLSESPAHLDDDAIEQIDSVDGGKDAPHITNRKLKFKRRHLLESPAHLDDEAIEQIDSVDGGKDIVPVTNKTLKSKRGHAQLDDVDVAYLQHIDRADIDRVMLMMISSKWISLILIARRKEREGAHSSHLRVGFKLLWPKEANTTTRSVAITREENSPLVAA
ncbi:unnamed protein product [Ambrosiozyma monospora]|uniref:Unnamed protein product n=1 Tax=Ambrosiozyma monospora TaxID=43982 RepID=A0A9W6YNM9_AMBMO|nr:unnamed protein product [Ambrosiozyma monospora]